MPNKKRRRRVMMPPLMQGFKPVGVPLRKLEPVDMTYEEFESVRLMDYENLNQLEASEKMNISRPTFTRLYDNARKKIAKAFVEGTSIMIKGGDYIADDYWFRCYKCNEVMITLKPVDNCTNCNSEDIKQVNESKNNQD
jgi:predicted DNA-binding protein (UPF0251 family)